jgi:TonB family protein
MHPAVVAKGANLGEACAHYYPSEARRLGLEGDVSLKVFIQPDGRVGEVVLESSSGSSLLDEAAAHCIRDEGRFVASVQDGKAVGSWNRIRWRWRILDGQFESALEAHYRPAIAAIRSGKADAGIEMAQRGLAAASSNLEREAALRILMWAAQRKPDWSMYLSYAVQLEAILPPTVERGNLERQIAELYADQGNLPQALAVAERSAEIAPSSEAFRLVGSLHRLMKDDLGAVPWLERTVQDDSPTEADLRQLYSAVVSSGNAASEVDVLRRLCRHYPRGEYLARLTELEIPTAGQAQRLHLLRLLAFLWQKADTAVAAKYAVSAFYSGYPEESLAVLDEAVRRGALQRTEGSPFDVFRGQANEARLKLEGHSPSRSEGWLGLHAYARGQFAEAAQHLEDALSDPLRGTAMERREWRLVLGMAQVRKGEGAAASGTFDEATDWGGYETAAGLWRVASRLPDLALARP